MKILYTHQLYIPVDFSIDIKSNDRKFLRCSYGIFVFLMCHNISLWWQRSNRNITYRGRGWQYAFMSACWWTTMPQRLWPLSGGGKINFDRLSKIISLYKRFCYLPVRQLNEFCCRWICNGIVTQGQSRREDKQKKTTTGTRALGVDRTEV